MLQMKNMFFTVFHMFEQTCFLCVAQLPVCMCIIHVNPRHYHFDLFKVFDISLNKYYKFDYCPECFIK